MDYLVQIWGVVAPFLNPAEGGEQVKATASVDSMFETFRNSAVLEAINKLFEAKGYYDNAQVPANLLGFNGRCDASNVM